MVLPVTLRDDALMLCDEGMSDEIVIGSFVFNKDKSITANCLVNVYHPDGRLWSTTREIRIPLDRND